MSTSHRTAGSAARPLTVPVPTSAPVPVPVPARALPFRAVIRGARTGRFA
ncbi:hypothetical protein ACFVHB_37170 [Kitasatospora sp. NPDC127111]